MAAQRLVALALSAVLIPSGTAPAVAVRAAAHVAPSPRQMAWQREELTAFIHFGPNTFDGREWGTGTESARLFNPSHVDPDQWMRVLRRAGFRKVILVTKHHDGFVLWPTRYTTHCVTSSPWLAGHGDLVRAFVNAAHKYHLAVGFYLSPADLYQAQPGGSYANGSTPKPSTIPTILPGDTRHPKRFFHFTLDDYNRYYMNELYELLTEYGPVEEVWLDGANPLAGSGRIEHYDFSAWYAMIRALAPKAVIFGGPDINWVGNENGVARTTQWSVVAFTGTPRPDQKTALSDPTAASLGGRDDVTDPRTRELRWYPSECDARLEKTWFWHPHQPPKTLPELQSMYYMSVGRNCQLLLDVPPDTTGRFDAADVARLHQFGAWLHHEFSRDFAKGANVRRSISGTTGTWTLHPKHRARVGTIALQERIKDGQRIERFVVDVRSGRTWHRVADETTIGYKRLLRLPKPIEVDALTVHVLQARARPELLRITLYP